MGGARRLRATGGWFLLVGLLLLEPAARARADDGAAPVSALVIDDAALAPANVATDAPTREPWSLERRYRASTRAVRAGGVLLGVSVGGLAWLTAAYLRPRPDPCADVEGFCLDLRELDELGYRFAFVYMVLPFTACATVLGVGARRRRRVVGEMERSLDVAVGPGSFRLALTF